MSLNPAQSVMADAGREAFARATETSPPSMRKKVEGINGMPHDVDAAELFFRAGDIMLWIPSASPLWLLLYSMRSHLKRAFPARLGSYATDPGPLPLHDPQDAPTEPSPTSAL